MNVDLTKGTLANVFLLGSGVWLAISVLFFPDGLGIFSHYGGYFLVFLLGSSLLPFLRIRQSAAYMRQTASVIDNVRDLLSKGCGSDPNQLAGRVARPAYDLFLRELPTGDRIIERVHDLGQQVRLMYAVARLFQLYAVMIGFAGLVKLILATTHPNWAAKILLFLPPIVWAQFACITITILICGSLGLAFSGMAEIVLTRQRNLELILVFNNKHFFIELGEKIKKDSELVTRLFPAKTESIPNIPLQP